MNDSIKNSYVGPRTFTPEEHKLFFGRDREARELLALVVSNRVMVFYAQSGAGKSSLINTKLVQNLRKERFLVLPIGRVSGGVDPAKETYSISNIYAFNLMLCLDQDRSHKVRYAGLDLNQFLNKLTTKDGRSYKYNSLITAGEKSFKDVKPQEHDF